MSHSDSSPAIRALKDVSFGSIAGIASKIFEHPFDLTKVRLQAQVLDTSTTQRFNGPIDCLTRTWKKEGIRGLYRGLPAPIVGAMVENASLFFAYNELQRLINWSSGTTTDSKLSIPQIAVAAGGAGAFTSFLLTPIELIKCKMQVQMLAADMHTSPAVAGLALTAHAHPPPPTAILPTSIRALPGPFALIMSVLRTHGLKGFWLGQTGTLLRESGGSAAWFGANEAVSSLLLSTRHPGATSKRDLNIGELALAGAAAGISYNLTLFPADSVKSAMQTAEELGRARKGVGFFGFAREMYRAQGIRGFYAGCGITVARSIPSSAMIFVIYDGLNARFG